jgi:hypothetical protein
MNDSSKLIENLGRFRPTIRSFQIVGGSLELIRSYSSKSIDSDLPPFGTQVLGEGTVGGGDKVVVIGTELSTRDIRFTISTDERRAARWRLNCRMTPDPMLTGNEQVDKYVAHWHGLSLERGNENPPTAVLFHYAGRLLDGIQEQWACELQVDTAVMAALESDLIAGRVDTIDVWVEWFIPLVNDPHLPPQMSHVWGMLPEGTGLLSETMTGTVTGLSWRPKLGPIVPTREFLPAAEENGDSSQLKTSGDDQTQKSGWFGNRGR